MKTTAGKTRPAPKGKRLIKIYAVDGRRTIAQGNHASLKDALRSYFEGTYLPKGGWDFKIVGNTMQVFKGDSVRTFRALELYQEP